MMDGIKWMAVICCVILSVSAKAQFVKEGHIVYERRTNLFKVMDDERMRNWIGEKNKIKIDEFNLYFNDTASLFSYIQPATPDPQSFLTIKNTIYNDFSKKIRTVYMNMMGSTMTIEDTFKIHTWKITDKTRKIAGYECTRIIWNVDDSTRIHAWYTTDIIPTVGPENILGLPGAILGMATEDGSVVYFAKKVEAMKPTIEQIGKPKIKGKIQTEGELVAELKKKLEGQPYGDRILKGLFFW